MSFHRFMNKLWRFLSESQQQLQGLAQAWDLGQAQVVNSVAMGANVKVPTVWPDADVKVPTPWPGAMGLTETGVMTTMVKNTYDEATIACTHSHCTLMSARAHAYKPTQTHQIHSLAHSF